MSKLPRFCSPPFILFFFSLSIFFFPCLSSLGCLMGYLSGHLSSMRVTPPATTPRRIRQPSNTSMVELVVTCYLDETTAFSVLCQQENQFPRAYDRRRR
ncbi:uncharacterized protein B0H64DRAFT_385065 [Chaetomium fimeti]|uniref:Uncharacterized protein n=1 Tax=Chaetomium fimeti TaxID=1854472 RepID=A0AAE0HL32_9PEZI|nr:hypothetical protein B0H64DRAFT_385065 [Chaetomium fimeti]